MRISQKLSLFFAGVVVIIVVLAFALIWQLRRVAASYDAVLNVPIHQMQEAKNIQVDFKKQVQEWKNILIRGGSSEELAAYTQAFRSKQSEVRDEAESLMQDITDGEAQGLLKQFLSAHEALSKQYETAYAAYVSGDGDFKAADKIVRGQDRAPTDLFDAVVARLSVVANQAIDAQRTKSARDRNIAVFSAAGCLFVLGIVGWLVVHDIQTRIRHLKQVSDRLAVADVSGLTVDIQGHDEIADFALSLKGVHAAIDELLHAQTAAKAVGRG